MVMPYSGSRPLLMLASRRLSSSFSDLPPASAFFRRSVVSAAFALNFAPWPRDPPETLEFSSESMAAAMCLLCSRNVPRSVDSVSFGSPNLSRRVETKVA